MTGYRLYLRAHGPFPTLTTFPLPSATNVPSSSVISAVASISRFVFLTRLALMISFLPVGAGVLNRISSWGGHSRAIETGNSDVGDCFVQ